MNWADADPMAQLREAILKQREDSDGKRKASELGVVHDEIAIAHRLPSTVNGVSKHQLVSSFAGKVEQNRVSRRISALLHSKHDVNDN